MDLDGGGGGGGNWVGGGVNSDGNSGRLNSYSGGASSSVEPPLVGSQMEMTEIVEGAVTSSKKG